MLTPRTTLRDSDSEQRTLTLYILKGEFVSIFYDSVHVACQLHFGWLWLDDERVKPSRLVLVWRADWPSVDPITHL